jgi:hypothetical protein
VINLLTPAFVPIDFLKWQASQAQNHRESETDPEDAAVKRARAFVEAIPSYRLVFGAREYPVEGSPKPLIEEVDTIITSVGGMEDAWIGGGEPFFDPVEEKSALQKEGVVGDICGRYVTLDKVDNFKQDSMTSRVNRRVFGPEPKHFRACAERARQSEDRLGVLVVAAGAGKAEVVLSICRRTLVNELIINDELADKLLELHKKHPAPMPI